MQRAVCAESFHGQDFFFVAFEGEQQAGENRFAIEQHSAGAALAKFAAVFCAGVVEIFAKNFEQCFVGCEGNIGLFAVQGETDLCGFVRDGGNSHHFGSPVFASFLLMLTADRSKDRPLRVRRLEVSPWHRPRIKYAANRSASSSAVSAPWGLNQRMVEFRAPRINRAARAGSVSANSPERIPAAITWRTPCS